jgi:hypothetical protein
MGVRRENIAKGVLLITSFAFAFTVAEFIARRVIPIDTGSSFAFRVPHPVLGWSLEPNASYTNRLPEASVKVTYNDRGWRDRNHRREVTDGKERIVTLGDSFMEAYSVDFSDSIHAQLERQASLAGRELEVINLGVGGFGTLQSYLAYREEGKLYSPDLVLLGFFAENDVANNTLELERLRVSEGLKVESRPFLDGDSTEWVVSSVDYDGARQRYELAKARRNTGLRRVLREHSVLLRLIWTRLKGGGGGPEPQTDAPRTEEVETALFGVHMCEERPAIARGWRITRRILSRLNEAIEESGAKLVVFNVPATHEVDPAAMEAVQAEVAETRLCLEDAPAQIRLRGVLEELGIPMIDLLPALRETHRSKNRSVYWESDRHWNPTGHAVAAATIYEQLVEMGLLSR